MCSNENDIIADVFCGSGTTGVVAKKLNRKYILCDNNPKACKISKERINKVTS
jgi:DNA modification methylase